MALAHETKAAKDGYTKLGEAGTYTPPGGAAVSVTVTVERGVDLYAPDRTLLSERRTVIGLLLEEVAAPRPNATVTVGAETWTLESRLSDDGIEARWLAK